MLSYWQVVAVSTVVRRDRNVCSGSAADWKPWYSYEGSLLWWIDHTLTSHRSFLSLLWGTFIMLVSVVFRPAVWVPQLKRVFANKRAVEDCASIIFSKLVKFMAWVSVLWCMRPVTYVCLLDVGRGEQRWCCRYSKYYGLEDRKVVVRFPTSTAGLCYSLRPDLPWGPLIFLFIGYCGLFLRG